MMAIGLGLEFFIILSSLQITFMESGYKFDPVMLFQKASAHFFGVPILENKTVDNYKIVFQPFPTMPAANDNSTKINLSILDKENQNINAVFSSLIIKEKDSPEILKTFPYQFYEFSDMTFSYTFPKEGTYLVTLLSKINADPFYMETPLIVEFELPVGAVKYYLTLTQSIFLYLTIMIAIIGAIIFYRRTRIK
jgi:hypothetical protein